MEAAARFSRSEKVTFLVLFAGYVAYYLTRKNITVAAVSMKDLGVLSMAQIGYLASLGTFFYAVGKFTNGFVSDRIGGKRVFLVGMAGSVFATFLFGLSSTYGAFLAAWALNSYFLSMGWAGLIRVMSFWFGGERRGTTVGWMSLTYQLGSSAAKVFTAFLMAFPLLVWRGLFFVPALALLGMAAVTLFLLRERPPAPRPGEAEPGPRATGPQGAGDPGAAASGSWLRLLRSPAFLLVLWGSAAVTLVRTFFDDFTALWLHEAGLAADRAGCVAALFTVGGMAGTVLAGYVSDRIGNGNRGPVLVVSGLLLGVLLLSSGAFPKDSAWSAGVFLTLSGVFLYGIYSILAGVAAIDFGGSTAPSTAAGIIDGVGYLAAAGAGLLVARMESYAGWESLVSVFAVLTMVISLTLLPLCRSYPARSLTASPRAGHHPGREGQARASVAARVARAEE